LSALDWLSQFGFVEKKTKKKQLELYSLSDLERKQQFEGLSHYLNNLLFDQRSSI